MQLLPSSISNQNFVLLNLLYFWTAAVATLWRIQTVLNPKCILTQPTHVFVTHNNVFWAMLVKFNISILFLGCHFMAYCLTQLGQCIKNICNNTQYCLLHKKYFNTWHSWNSLKKFLQGNRILKKRDVGNQHISYTSSRLQQYNLFGTLPLFTS